MRGVLYVGAMAQTSRVTKGLPPGPSGWLWTTIRLLRDPIGALHEWREEYGSTFTIRLLDSPIVMTCEPELVRQIYAVTDTEQFGSNIPASFAALSGAESLLMLSGARHHAERKLLMPAFHGERMRGWAQAMVDAARRAFAGGGEFPVLERTRQATLEVIVRLVFGASDADQVDEFTRLAGAWARAVRPGFLFVSALQREFLGLSAFARFRRASDALDRSLMQQIATTRANPGSRTDVLASMVGARYDDGSAMTDAAICDQLHTLLFAGHDTTAVVLAWALYFLARDPEALERSRSEADALGPEPDAEALARLPWLGAVVDETLRLRPVTSEAIRRLHKPWQLGSWQLPAGVSVSAVAPLIHSRADLWPEPEQFRPERFLAERPSPTVYLPFGGGARRCIGATFARFEACVILSTLLREFEFESRVDQVVWGRGLLILEPIGGVPMRVRPREASPLAAQGSGDMGTMPLRV